MEKYVPADLPEENEVAVSSRLAPHAAPLAPRGHQLRGSAPRTERSILCRASISLRPHTLVA